MTYAHAAYAALLRAGYDPAVALLLDLDLAKQEAK